TRVVFQTAQTLQTHYDPQGQSPMTYEFKWCCEESYPAKEWIAALSPHFRGKLLSEIHRHGPSLQQEMNSVRPLVERLSRHCKVLQTTTEVLPMLETLLGQSDLNP